MGQLSHDVDMRRFAADILKIDSGLDFKVGSRGWAYILESHGLIDKGQFDDAQRRINECRKAGLLPLDICLNDEGRAFMHVQEIDRHTPEDEAQGIIAGLSTAHTHYLPIGFWDDQERYVQMLVEKATLKSLFERVCAEFYVPLATASGWSDINQRADMMKRFAEMEERGKQCVLLYCGDHDPGGLLISGFLRSNMKDIEKAVCKLLGYDWSSGKIIIERFGLNYDFIEEHGLTWIDNLVTQSGVCLSDQQHHDCDKRHVQEYIEKFGVRKVEAEALVKVPHVGRGLCRQAILQYVDEGAPVRYAESLAAPREEVRNWLAMLLGERILGS